MRISKVVSVNSHRQKETFVFGDSSFGSPVLPCKNLCDCLTFCFSDEASDDFLFAEITFDVGEEYVFSKFFDQNGACNIVLKQNGFVVSQNQKALDFMRGALLLDLNHFLRETCVSERNAEAFDGDLSKFPKLRTFLSVNKEIETYVSEMRVKLNDASQRVKEYSENSQNVTKSQIDEAFEQAQQVMQQLESTLSNIKDVEKSVPQKEVESKEQFVREILQKAQIAQSKLDLLVSREAQIAEAENRIADAERAQRVATQLANLRDLQKQKESLENKRDELQTELEWKQREAENVVKEYDEKKSHFDALREKQFRADAVNNELSYISKLYEQNQKLSQLVSELTQKKAQFTDERAECLRKLGESERAFDEVKPILEDAQRPTKSMGDILESVRVDAKIDEVDAQLTKLQNEINLNESRIAEKESNLSMQKKRFRSVVELDAAVSPIKAKDTILQVLNGKYNKLEAINASLEDKQRNLNRSLEDFRFRISQTEQSRQKLVAQRDKALLRKQEEFKREVFVNSQKVFSEDASSVFAVSADFRDEEIISLNNQIAQREEDRDRLVKLASQIEGAIKEIKRHIEINAAEMDTLRNEKSNINNRYNEIVAENSSEAVFNYLKALHNDSGTKYLLDVQQNTVQAESELTELKRYTDSLKQKVASLKNRLKNLKETQEALEGVSVNPDSLASANDKLKENLIDIGDRMSLCYEQFVSLCKRIENLNLKLENINSALTESEKTVKVNKTQIKAAYERAKKYAESDDLEKALSDFRYELNDVESELRMLEESKNLLLQQVFEHKSELKKTQWLLQNKTEEYDKLLQRLQAEGIADDVSTPDEDSVENLRRQIKKFRELKQRLTHETEFYREVLTGLHIENTAEFGENLFDAGEEAAETDKTADAVEAASGSATDERDGSMPLASGESVDQAEFDDIYAKNQSFVTNAEELLQRQKQLLDLQKQRLDDFLQGFSDKMKVTAAAAEVNVLTSLKQMSMHFNIVSLFVSEKISALMKEATQKLQMMSDSNLVISEKRGFAQISDGTTTWDYQNLPRNTKTAVYAALLLAAEADSDRCIVFDDAEMDWNGVSRVLSKTEGMVFPVEHTSEKI